jgi:hypothetical protein
MAAYGWTWEYIDENMTIPRLNTVHTHWEYAPPVHMMIASFFGLKRPGSKKQQDAAIAELLAMFPTQG